MTMPYHIQIGQSLSSTQKAQVQKIIDDTFAEINDLANHWNPNSEISRVNKTPGTLQISPHLAHILHLAISLSKETNGLYDPTLGLPIKFWKRSLAQGHLPLGPMPKCGLTQFTLQGTTLTKHTPLAFDLDGLIKGYTIDLLTTRLSYPSLYIEWAGDLRVQGLHPENRPWRIQIKNSSQILEVSDTALATSGIEYQTHLIGSHTYTHIIHPTHLQALKDPTLSQTTKEASTCARADALATAALLK